MSETLERAKKALDSIEEYDYALNAVNHPQRQLGTREFSEREIARTILTALIELLESVDHQHTINPCAYCDRARALDVELDELEAPSLAPVPPDTPERPHGGARMSDVMEKARKVAEELLERWEISTPSTFCDESDWDSAEPEDIAKVIARAILAAQIDMLAAVCEFDNPENGSRWAAARAVNLRRELEALK